MRYQELAYIGLTNAKEAVTIMKQIQSVSGKHMKITNKFIIKLQSPEAYKAYTISKNIT